LPVIYGVSDETVREILTTVRTIAVVGASPNPAPSVQ
jgi:predicted CoA-binding protein